MLPARSIRPHDLLDLLLSWMTVDPDVLTIYQALSDSPAVKA